MATPLPEQPRTVPLAGAVVAAENPLWFYNLAANPTVTVEVGTDTWEATAQLTEGDERKRLFDAQAALMPQFAEYEKSAGEHGREIPVFRLVRS